MERKRKGDWFCTFKGIKFWPLDPLPDEILIEDIAHSLSNISRFGGHAKYFYSVAQHSYYVSQYVKRENALYGLMHDSQEGYLGDCVKPLKPYLTNFKEIEDNLLYAIANKFGFRINDETSKDIKQADIKLLFTEARDLTHEKGLNWSDRVEPLSCFEILPWQPAVAKEKFLQRFHELTNNKWK